MNKFLSFALLNFAFLGTLPAQADIEPGSYSFDIKNSEPFHYENNLGVPITLRIENKSGNIAIEPSETGKFSIVATQRGGQSGGKGKLEMNVFSKGDIEIKTTAPQGSNFVNQGGNGFSFVNVTSGSSFVMVNGNIVSGGGVVVSGSAAIDLVIRVPMNQLLNATLETYGGDARISGFKTNQVNEIKINTYSGDAQLNHLVARNIAVKTYSGDIVSTALFGDVRLETYSGDISARGNSHGDMDATSYSGDVAIYDQQGGDVRLKTYSGDIDENNPMASSIRITKAGRVKKDVKLRQKVFQPLPTVVIAPSVPAAAMPISTQPKGIELDEEAQIQLALELSTLEVSKVNQADLPNQNTEDNRVAPVPNVVKEEVKPQVAEGKGQAASGGEDENTCIVCMDAARCAVLVPCGHLQFCKSCADKVVGKPCPSCRTPVQSAVKVYN